MFLSLDNIYKPYHLKEKHSAQDKKQKAAERGGFKEKVILEKMD